MRSSKAVRSLCGQEGATAGGAGGAERWQRPQPTSRRSSAIAGGLLGSAGSLCGCPAGCCSSWRSIASTTRAACCCSIVPQIANPNADGATGLEWEPCVKCKSALGYRCTSLALGTLFGS